MRKSDLKSYIKEEIINRLSEVIVVDKNTRPEDIKSKDSLTVKTAIDTAKKSNKPVSIAEKEDDDVEVEDNWYKSKDEDGDKDKEPSKADLKKQAVKTKGLTKVKDELATLTKEMKSLARKYKEATGADKDKIVADLKSKTKLKKELESILDL